MRKGSFPYYQKLGYSISAQCLGCARISTLDLDEMTRRFGPDYVLPDHLESFSAALVCTCGHKGGIVTVGGSEGAIGAGHGRSNVVTLADFKPFSR